MVDREDVPRRRFVLSSSEDISKTSTLSTTGDVRARVFPLDLDVLFDAGALLRGGGAASSSEDNTMTSASAHLGACWECKGCLEERDAGISCFVPRNSEDDVGTAAHSGNGGAGRWQVVVGVRNASAVP